MLYQSEKSEADHLRPDRRVSFPNFKTEGLKNSVFKHCLLNTWSAPVLFLGNDIQASMPNLNFETDICCNGDHCFPSDKDQCIKLNSKSHYIFGNSEFQSPQSPKNILERTFTKESWSTPLQFYLEDKHNVSEDLSDLFFDARSDSFFNLSDEGDISSFSFPTTDGFAGANMSFPSSDDDKDDTETFENENSVSHSKDSGTNPVTSNADIASEVNVFNCKDNITVSSFLATCSTMLMSLAMNRMSDTISNTNSKDKVVSFETLKNHSVEKERSFQVESPLKPRYDLHYPSENFRSGVICNKNCSNSVEFKSSSKQIAPFSKRNARLTLLFDSKEYFRKLFPLQGFEYWKSIEELFHPLQRGKILPITCNQTEISDKYFNAIIPAKIEESLTFNSLIQQMTDETSESTPKNNGKHSNETEKGMYDFAAQSGLKNDSSPEEEFCSAASSNHADYCDEDFFSDLDVESEGMNLGEKFDKDCFDDLMASDISNDDLCPNEINNFKKAIKTDGSKTGIEAVATDSNSFLENDPVLLEYLDYDTEEMEALLIYPLECLAKIKSQKQGRLTKKQIAEQMLKRSNLSCSKPMGVMSGIKEILSQFKKQSLSENNKRNKAEWHNCPEEKVQPNVNPEVSKHVKNLRNNVSLNTNAVSLTPYTQKSTKSGISCSVKAKGDAATHKISPKHCIPMAKTPPLLNFSQSSQSRSSTKTNRKLSSKEKNVSQSTFSSSSFAKDEGKRSPKECHSMIKTPRTLNVSQNSFSCSSFTKVERKLSPKACPSMIKIQQSLNNSQKSFSCMCFTKVERKQPPTKSLSMVQTPKISHIICRVSPRENVSSPPNKLIVLNRKRGTVEDVVSSDFKMFFRSFAKLGHRIKSGTVITKANSNFWLKKTGVVYDSESMKIADQYFSEKAGGKLVLNIYDYVHYLQAISRSRKMTLSELVIQLKTADISEVMQMKKIPQSEEHAAVSRKSISCTRIPRKNASSVTATVSCTSAQKHLIQSKIPVASPTKKYEFKK